MLLLVIESIYLIMSRILFWYYVLSNIFCSGTILDKVNASIPMPPGHVLSRYLLMNKTGFDLDLEQVGSNIYRRLPSCTRWVQIHTIIIF